jgi:S1 RNA binding domain protein
MSDELIGQIVEGDVTNITRFGAFIKLFNGEEGLVHISEVANEYVSNVEEYVKLGDKIKVKILSRNPKGKLELSIKQTIEKPIHDTPVLNRKSNNQGFEDRLSQFLKRSEEKQIDIRRNLKHKQGIIKKKR